MAFLSRPGLFALGFVAVVPVIASGACSAAPGHNAFTAGTAGNGGSASAGTDAGGAGSTLGSSQGGSSASLMIDAGAGTTGAGGGIVGDPTTCAQAAANKTYIGCDFWPTVTANLVFEIFDFAAVVANAGTEMATVTVTGPGSTNLMVQVAPNSLQKIYLPWVDALKGGSSDECENVTLLSASVSAPGGAYHLVSSVPVTVYQFNALEYSAQGGPSGKDWSSCPGDQTCTDPTSQLFLESSGCFSFTNDASLLLPSTAMTGNYRITALDDNGIGANVTVTATQPNTSVTMYVAPAGHVLAGGPGIPDTPGGGKFTFTLANAGDVVQLQSDGLSDLAGSLIQATLPVQVIAGMVCADVPSTASACDHLEQTVFPAETLGKHYFVSQPTAPHSTASAPILKGQVVRIIGNAAGTTLTYPGGTPPPKAPLTLTAGQVVDMGVVTKDFEIQGNHEFAVATFMLGASVIDPNTHVPNQLGDPSQSNAVGVEQYRIKYVFLAPSDYTESYVDITMPMTAQVVLDGAALTVAPKAISSGYGIARVPLGAGTGGAHVLTSSAGVGIQVIGYGQYTSYQYPGGLNLDVIAPPPPPPG